MLRSSSRLLRKVVNSSQVAAKTVSARQTQVYVPAAAMPSFLRAGPVPRPLALD